MFRSQHASLVLLIVPSLVRFYSVPVHPCRCRPGYLGRRNVSASVCCLCFSAHRVPSMQPGQLLSIALRGYTSSRSDLFHLLWFCSCIPGTWRPSSFVRSNLYVSVYIPSVECILSVQKNPLPCAPSRTINKTSNNPRDLALMQCHYDTQQDNYFTARSSRT